MARHLLALSEETLLDIGLTKHDIRCAIRSKQPLKVLCEARHRDARASGAQSRSAPDHDGISPSLCVPATRRGRERGQL